MIETKHITVGALDIYVARIDPISKPRMTKRDKWKKRPSVLRYFAFRDEVREWIQKDGMYIQEYGSHIIFRIPLTPSWSNRKKQSFLGKPHRGTKDGARAMDKDNLEKALLDAVFGDDSWVWDSRSTKFWHTHGEIIIVNDQAAPLRARGFLEYADTL